MSLNVELLETSFAALAPQGDKLTEVFYDHLFDDFPGVQPLFAGVDIEEQQKKLLASLKLVVENLRRPEVLQPALEQLGLRHVDYGAQEAHYPAVGQTLIKSMAQVAGDLWSEDLQKAWVEAYGEVAATMLAGAAEGAAV